MTVCAKRFKWKYSANNVILTVIELIYEGGQGMLERRCIICGKVEQVEGYKQLTHSAQKYFVCDLCKAKVQYEAKEQQKGSKPM